MHTHARCGSHRTHAVALAAAALAAAAATVLLSGAPAHAATVLPMTARAAHIHIDGDASAGTTSTISFRVPTESDTASTVSVAVDVPADALITSASAEHKPGWDVEIVKSELNPPVTSGSIQIKSDVTRIVWTATDGGIPPAQYDEFTVRIAVPAAGTIALPVHQGYSDGTSVDWTDPMNADGSEPAHPAPTLEVAAAGTAPSDGPTDAPAAAGSDTDSTPDPSLWIGLAGLIVGALGLVVAIVALAVRRRPAV